MVKNSISQIALVVFAILALFGLYFFGKTTKPISIEQAAEAMREQVDQVNLNEDELISSAIEQLTEKEKRQYDSTAKEKVVEFWQSIDRNDIAAIVSFKESERSGSFAHWNKTGDLFVRGYRESQDSTNQMFFIQQAVSSYENALEFQADVNTKLKLAKLYTSLSGATMKGVLLLREIVEEEPKHIQANFELGMLSLQSGQNDKALERFNLLIQEEPKFIEPYILKAQLLLSNGQNSEAKNVIDVAIANTENAEGIAVLKDMKERIE